MASDNDPSFHHVFNFKFSLPYIKNKKVLDIGCWTGQFEKLAVKTTKQITGIDPGKNAILQAKKMVPNARFKVGNALDLPFSDKSFDTITMLDVIEHIPKNTESICLKEIRRVLKPDGYLILSTPNAHILSILLDPAFFLIGHRHYTKKDLTKLLEKSGFKILKTKKVGGVFRLSVSLVEIIYKHLFKKKYIVPDVIKEKIEQEYKSRYAFAQINMIGQLKQ